MPASRFLQAGKTATNEREIRDLPKPEELQEESDPTDLSPSPRGLLTSMPSTRRNGSAV